MNKTYILLLCRFSCNVTSNFVNIFPISCPLESQCFLFEQDVIVGTIANVGLQHPRIDWVPPTMSALHNDIKVIRVNVQSVLGSILTNHITKSILNFWRDGVFTCIHVCDVGMLQSLGEFCPCFMRDVIGLANVYAPRAVLGRLEHTEKVHHLIISHGFIEILKSCYERVERRAQRCERRERAKSMSAQHKCRRTWM